MLIIILRINWPNGIKDISKLWAGNFWMVDIGINAWSTLFPNLTIE